MTWEDTRVGRDSPWSPGLVDPRGGRRTAAGRPAVTFGRPGEYVLRALAHDGGLQTYQDVTVTVTP